MKKHNVSVDIVASNGKSINEYFHEGNTYIEAFKNKSFTLKITNHNFLDRVLVIPSIDGLSVLDGEYASENSPGYVVNPNTTIEIKGWRIDDETVSEFTFANKKDGYASATDQSGHEGSIGVMVFKEDDEEFKKRLQEIIDKINKDSQPLTFINQHHHYHPWNQPYWHQPTVWYGGSISGDTINCNASYSSANNAVAGGSLSLGTTSNGAVVNTTNERRINLDAQKDEKLAVGYGEQIESVVKETEFKRAEKPLDTFVFFYDTRKGLEKRGIKISEPPKIEEPSPFPASKKYCKMPEGGWKK